MTTATSVIPVKTGSKYALIALAFIAFISLGLPDGLLGVASPSIRATFGLPLEAMGMLFVSTVSGYMVSSFFSGRIIARLGVGGLLAASCFATGAALIGYTLAPGWWVIVVLGVIAGLGAGAIDAGLNTYIAANHGEGMMQWLHASFGVGITLGPLIMTAGIKLFETWRFGYVVVGSAQILLALCFALTRSMWRGEGKSAESADAQLLTDYKTPLRQTLRQPATWLSLLLFFLYAGCEMTLGQWGYTLLTEARGIAPESAGLLAGSYWGMFTVGRLIAGLYTRRVSNHTILRVSILAAGVGSVLLRWNPTETVGLLGIVIIGFAIAPIFPALVSGTAARVGVQNAANTIGMQMSAAGLGIAFMPSAAGLLTRNFGLEIIPTFQLVMVIALFVVYMLSMSDRVRARVQSTP